MNETDVQTFWQGHPCGDMMIGGLESYRNDYEQFFTEYDSFRYRTEKHILDCLDGIDFKGKKTLEIGLGQGADSEQIIRRGGIWSGVDLTQESVARLEVRLKLRDLPYTEVKQGSALELPFADDSFDIVYSHGVLHHIPDIANAQKEIHRVLKPTGMLVAMLYAKYSLNYLVSISILRRLGLIGLYPFNFAPGEKYRQHLENARQTGLFEYLKMKNFIHRNTDGPLNPYAKVYDKKSVSEDFALFNIDKAYKRFMHAPPLPVTWMPLQKLLGWHLWVHMKPK